MLLHFSTLSCSHWQLRMLILGKSHSLVESRNSRRGAITGRSPMLFPADAGTPLTDRHSRQWRARNVVKRPVGGLQGSATGQAQWQIGLRTVGRESPPAPVAGKLVDVAGAWVHRMAGSGQVSSAVARVSKCRLGMRRGDATADWPSGMGDHSPCPRRTTSR